MLLLFVGFPESFSSSSLEIWTGVSWAFGCTDLFCFIWAKIESKSSCSSLGGTFGLIFPRIDSRSLSLVIPLEVFFALEGCVSGVVFLEESGAILFFVPWMLSNNLS